MHRLAITISYVSALQGLRLQAAIAGLKSCMVYSSRDVLFCMLAAWYAIPWLPLNAISQTNNPEKHLCLRFSKEKLHQAPTCRVHDQLSICNRHLQL